jgi:hypothetical protein
LIGEWLAWFLSDDLGRDKLALIVLCTLVLYGLATHLAWRLLFLGTGRKLVVAVASSWAGRWLVQGLRLLYYAGIPLAVLLRGPYVSQMGVPTTYVRDWDGDAVLRLLSIAGVRDVRHLWGAIWIGLGGLCLLVAIEIWTLRTVPGLGNALSPSPAWTVVREAVFLQMLWALYRSLASTLVPRPLHAAFLSLALISLAWLLNPRRRHDLFTARGYAVVRDWLLALMTVLAAPRVGSLWLLMLMHALWLWASDRVWTRFSILSQDPKPLTSVPADTP